MTASSTARRPLVSDIVAARLTAGLSLILAMLTVASQGSGVMLSASATACALLAALMLLHRHGTVAARD